MTKVSTGKANKQRKRKAATNAIREIKSEQKNTSLIVPVAPMNRLISQIANTFKSDLRFKGEAYRALHSAVEEHIVDTFQRANLCAIHDNRETVQPKDVQLAQQLLSA
tara:strand:- start:1390 stop:1713 length:324 start_codon:yes stop_codon:yes gene_type:complete